jgi:hypothetical protein
MRIAASWVLFEDGESRPIVRVKVRIGDDATVAEQFIS